MRGIGQALERRRGADLAQQSPRFFAPAGAALRSTCGRQTTAWIVPCQQTQKSWSNGVKDYFLWY